MKPTTRRLLSNLGQRLESPTTNLVAVAVLAGITPAIAHEFVGHGSVCLAVGGHPTVVSTSMFSCTTPEPVIAVGGPAMNLLLGLTCLILLRRVRPANRDVRLYLALVTAFAWFWEGGYAVQAMVFRAGDLYDIFAATTGPPGPAVSAAIATAGAALYLLTARLTRTSIRGIADTELPAPRISRVAWISATATVAIAAARSPLGLHNFGNTVMSIGVAGLPLLLTPPRADPSQSHSPRPRAASTALLVTSLIAFTAFTCTLGQGIVWQ